MATGNISRRLHDPRMNYRGTKIRQGSVITDDDLNEAYLLADEETAADRIGIIGPVGTSDKGFLISLPETDDGNIDFTIGKGTYWIGGHRARFHEGQAYTQQCDWIRNPGTADADGIRIDLVYMEHFHQTVGYVEDGSLPEVALGLPGTSSRIKAMTRIRVLPDVQQDCVDAWGGAVQGWQDAHEGVLDENHEFLGDGVLTVTFSDEGTPESPCNPGTTGGYLGAENHTIRVQLVDSENFTWGFENGGQLYRAKLSVDGKSVELLTSPVDEAHWPVTGQTVEVLPVGAVLANGEIIAEELEDSFFTVIDSSYDSSTSTFTLSANAPEDMRQSEDLDELDCYPEDLPDTADNHIFVRIWDRGADLSSPAVIPVAPNALLGLTGLEVTIEGDVLRRGDHWTISARPHTPHQVVPKELLIGKAADGYRRFRAPLALIKWEPGKDPKVIDCRTTFRPLTHINTCNNFTVGDGNKSHGDFTSIQDALNALPDRGGQIMVLPGTYDEDVMLDGQKHITIVGCGRRTRITGLEGSTEPVISITASTHITLKKFMVDAPSRLGIAVIGVQDQDEFSTHHIKMEKLTVRSHQLGALGVAGCQYVSIRDSAILLVQEGIDKSFVGEVQRAALTLGGDNITVSGNRIAPPQSIHEACNALGGIHIAGGSTIVDISDNEISLGIGHGINLGSTIFITENKYDPNDPEQTLQDDIADMNGNVINENGCLKSVPNGTPSPPEGETFIAISAGDLTSVRITGNHIHDMGISGISVERFFDLTVVADMIGVTDLLIENNHIHDNLKRNQNAFSNSMVSIAALGGITLAEVVTGRFLNNRIEDNGNQGQNPVCGIYILIGQSIEIAHNRIVGNGAEHTQLQGVTAGYRGGVLISSLAPEYVPDEEGRRPNGIPALRMHGNVVVAPQGRALKATGVGSFTVTDNRFVSRVLDVGLGQVIGGLLKGIGQIAEMDYDGIQLTLVSQALIDLLGGGIVALANFGTTQEIEGNMSDFAKIMPQIGEDDADSNVLGLNGNVLFSDNQVELDSYGTSISNSFFSSALLFLSTDDVSIINNQVDLELDDGDKVLSDILALAFSVRMSNNRMKETFSTAMFSAVSLGVASAAIGNQSSHCILAQGWKPMSVNQANRSFSTAAPWLPKYIKAFCKIANGTLAKLMNPEEL